MGCTFVVVPSMGIKPRHLDSTGHDLSYAVIHVVEFCARTQERLTTDQFVCTCSNPLLHQLGSAELLPEFWKQSSQPLFFARHEDIGLLLHCCRLSCDMCDMRLYSSVVK